MLLPCCFFLCPGSSCSLFWGQCCCRSWRCHPFVLDGRDSFWDSWSDTALSGKIWNFRAALDVWCCTNVCVELGVLFYQLSSLQRVKWELLCGALLPGSCGRAQHSLVGMLPWECCPSTWQVLPPATSCSVDESCYSFSTLCCSHSSESLLSKDRGDEICSSAPCSEGEESPLALPPFFFF